MGVLHIDLMSACAAVETVADQLTSLLRSVPDPTTPIGGMDWTVGQTAAHLVVALRGFASAAAGVDFDGMEAYDPAIPIVRNRMATGNDLSMSRIAHDDTNELADLIAQGTRAFLEATEGRSAGERVHTPWYGSKDIHTQASAAGMVLGELLVHGYDIANAVGAPWQIRPEHARVTLCAVPEMLPLYVDADAADGVTAAFDIHVRGGPRYVIYVRDVNVSVQPFSSQPVDCHLSADPVAFLLLTYGRRDQWGEILRGKVFVWGRRPLLGLKLRKMFFNP
jgi:uncharacterized protein (TIGR03083 family)